jgi:NADPH:quinone reductase
MVKAVVIRSHGGPEVLGVEDMELAPPGPDEARIRHHAIGINFIDVYFRTGLYPAPNGLPLIPGNEGAGVVVSVGSNVSSLKAGDRIAYAATIGAYCEERNIAADRLVKLPDSISFETAAAMMLKGMTVEYLLRRTFRLEAGHTALFHAAAGGVGQVAGQWGKHIGATMIGTAGSPEKVELAKSLGYAHVINYNTENFVERVKEITGNKGVDVVYDSVGKTTWLGSLDCLRPRGMFATFGQSSGPIEGFTLAHLAQRGSLFATRPTLFVYTASRADLELSAGSLFDVVAQGAVKINVNQRFALADAAEAHRSLEGRSTTGSTILLP